jgi:uncharacterized protein (DUF885 family)
MPVARRLWSVLVVTLALVACGRSASGPDAETDADSSPVAHKASKAQAAKLLRIAEDYYDAYLELNPWTATAEGDHRHDADFGDYVSVQWMANSLAIEQEALEKLQAVDSRKLQGEDLVTYEAFRQEREIRIEGFRYPSELLPLQPFANLAVDFALAGSGQGIQPFRSTADYDHFLSRMDGFGAWVDRTIDNLKSGMAKGVVQPRVLIDRLLPELAGMQVEDPRQSIFWRPILSFPAGVSVTDRRRLTEAYATKIGGMVLPAYRRLHDFLADTYLPKARTTIGLSELPNGAAWYAYLVRRHTSLSLTPDEVHQLGLSEVARVRAVMEKRRSGLGHAGDLQSRLEALRTEPGLRAADAAALLDAYRALSPRVGPALPLLFASRPGMEFVVRPVEPFRAASAAAVSYEPGSVPDKRPGVVYVNVSDLASRPTFAVESSYLHAGDPGRHLQDSIAQEARDLPRFQRYARGLAFDDGWALYAESLGADLGLYTDPYAAFGALASDARYAALLVVDTGIHAKGWSREKAIDYLRANTALGESEISQEVDRCIAMPGQVLTYKLGQLEILKLRQRAQQKLGARFDIRAFHSQILDSGNLPLPVLESKIDRWLVIQQ